MNDQWVKLASEVASQVLAKHAASVDQENRFPTEAFQALREAGLMGLLAPQEYGGASADLGTAVQVWERLAQGCASTALCYVMHCAATACIAAGAAGSLRREVLEAVASGRSLLTLAYSEPGTGSRPNPPDAFYTLSGQECTLTGMKAFVTSALYADAYLMPAVQKGSTSVSLFLVPVEVEGLQLFGEWKAMGLRGAMSLNVRLQNARVSTHQRVGEEGQGMRILENHGLPVVLAGTAAMAVGVAQAALDACRRHVQSRRYSQQGGALGDVPVIRGYLADMYVAVEASRALLQRAVASPQADIHALWAAKLASCQAAMEVTSRALQVCGGRGYLSSAPVERHFRDSLAGPLIGPTSEWLRAWLGEHLAQTKV